MEPNLRRRGVIKRDQVRGDGQEAHARAPTVAAQNAEAHLPRARLVRIDENTQAIEFTCPCGEVSLIEIQSEKKP
ncbi:MAG: hypothetical protein HOP15_17320 [Planctomycetes bacterium]|nr:hypothetical protein [Planctomycetota bacterium]